MGLLDSAARWIQEAAGISVISTDERKLHEATTTELLRTRRDYDLLGYRALEYMAGHSQADAPVQSRRDWARSSREVWQTDPMAGAAVDLLNDFTFSRGVPQPRARDESVQQVIDEAWKDVDNKAVLTTYAAQIALGTDLSIQSNVFLVIFDHGDDGKVKSSLMPHDRVIDVVRDPQNPMRILYYVVEMVEYEWDFENDTMKNPLSPAASGRGGTVSSTAGVGMKKNVRYYEHWQNPRMLREAGVKFPVPPKEKLATGKLYHVAENRMSEMAFGVPKMQRTLRWLSGYNEVVAARVDMAKAAAAFIMKRTVKGTPNQLAKQAEQAISRRGELGAASTLGTGTLVPPASGSFLYENEAITSEPLKLDSGSAGALQDSQMIRAQVSAAVGWPQHYLGDASAASIAGNTALELPVLKHVEARQELFENLFRAFIDRVIERAVDTGLLDRTDGENKAEGEALSEPGGEQATEAADAGDEAATERDLSYEFSMPSPMRRMMTDLVTAIANVARTFDPNNTNLELSRTLLTIALGEAFEMQDPAEAVDRILPEGYQDPAVVAAQNAAEQQQMPPGGPEEVGNSKGEGAPTGGDGTDQATNPYGAPMKGSTREQNAAVKEAVELAGIEGLLLSDDRFRDAWIAATELATDGSR